MTRPYLRAPREDFAHWPKKNMVNGTYRVKEIRPAYYVGPRQRVTLINTDEARDPAVIICFFNDPALIGYKEGDTILLNAQWELIPQ